MTKLESRFKVGDIVRVVDDIKTLKVSGDGSKNHSYVKPMNEFCGKFATVTNVSRAIGSFELCYSLMLKGENGATSTWWFLESHIVPLDEDDELSAVDSDELMKLVFG